MPKTIAEQYDKFYPKLGEKLEAIASSGDIVFIAVSPHYFEITFTDMSKIQLGLELEEFRMMTKILFTKMEQIYSE